MNPQETLQVYQASFKHGVRVCLSERSDLVSMILIYATLLVVFYHVFKIMPIEELGRHDLTRLHFFWYFMVTEIILVSVQGNDRELGRLVAEGQLTVLMQRPGRMLGLFLSRVYGTIFANAVLLSSFALLLVPLVTRMAMPMPWQFAPLFMLSVMMAMLIFLTIGYCVGMLEIFGPYSRSFSWISNKMIFTFGGLFFPVIFYPNWLQHLVHFTPAPAVLFAPGSFMLNPSGMGIATTLGEQALWLILCLAFAAAAEKKMIKRVLVHGD